MVHHSPSIGLSAIIIMVFALVAVLVLLPRVVVWGSRHQGRTEEHGKAGKDLGLHGCLE